MLNLIVAMDENNCIGSKLEIPWKIKDDQLNFLNLTREKTMIMGRNTFQSIAMKLEKLGKDRKQLKSGRTTIILTDRNEEYPENCIAVHSIEEALKTVEGKEAFVCGGGMIYKQFLPFCDRLYITEVKTKIEGGDTFFPEIDKKIWKEISREKHYKDERNDFDFDIVVYEKA